MKTNYLANSFEYKKLPQDLSYEAACDISTGSTLEHWQTVIDAILKHHQFEMQALPRVSSGECPVFPLAVDGQVQALIKFVAPNFISQYEAEVTALKSCVGAKLPVAIPKLLASQIHCGWGYLIISKVNGVMLNEVLAELSQQDKLNIARQLGEFCRALHQIPVTADHQLALDWPAFIKQQNHTSYAKRKRQGLRSDLLADFIPYIAFLAYPMPAPEHYVLMHTDLHPGNLLVEKNDDGYNLSGVIDFGDALVGADEAFEFTTVIMLYCLGDGQLVNAYLNGYNFDITDKVGIMKRLMALTLLRHTGDLNYLIEHVPNVAQCTSWKETEPYLFPI